MSQSPLDDTIDISYLLALRITLRLQEDKPSTHQNVNGLKWFE
jgi:hypothetical protein